MPSKEALNIAFVLAYMSDRYGGSVMAVKQLGRVVAREGPHVSYWATGDNQDRAELRSIKDAHLYDVQWPRRWYRSRALQKALCAYLPQVDIVHINQLWLHPLYMGAKAARKRGVPYILRPAGSLEPWALYNSKAKWLKKQAYLAVIGKPMMQHAACLHACSVQEARHFRQAHYDGPIALIPNGVDVSEYAPGDGSEADELWPSLRGRQVVLFMSRLSPEKGLDMLIPAWSELLKKRPSRDAVLVLAGPSDRGYGTVVEAMVDKYDLRSRILFAGMVRGHQKLALLRRADVFVLPSYSENFGIVVAEALACGAPVITTTATPWSELQKVGAGRWIKPEKTELIHALSEIIDMSQSQRKMMGTEARSLIERSYAWDEIARRFVAVCGCILQGKPIPFSEH